jgi:CheY-like chemotaxis protein
MAWSLPEKWLMLKEGRSVKEIFTILIADRNRYVREFLKREFIEEGYRVELAKNSKEITERISCQEPLELLILDLDMPDADGLDLLEGLLKHVPTLPIVVHTFISEYNIPATTLEHIELVEKGGGSSDNLKEVVFALLRKTYPQRFEAGQEKHPTNLR